MKKNIFTAAMVLALFGGNIGNNADIYNYNPAQIPCVNVAAAKGVPENFAYEVLRLINIERSNNGLNPLFISESLNYGAMTRAQEISTHFSHTRPNGQNFYTVFNDSNAQYTMGENIAAGYDSPAAVVKGWMSSPGHRANILNSDYDEVGIGFYYDKDSEYKNYWVQIFKRPLSRAYR